MDGDNVVKDLTRDLIITGVKFTDRELSRGAYGSVLAVDYNGIMCAAKEIQPILRADSDERAEIKKCFWQECFLHSKLHHPNIVKMLGLFYRNDQVFLPVLVMELMECNLREMLESYQNIPMYVKL